MVPRGETGSRAWVGAEGPGPRHGLQLSPAARAVRRACPRVGVPVCARAPPQSLRHCPDACALCSAKVPDALGGNSVFPEASARASGSGTGQRSGDLWREHVCVSLRWLVPSAGPRPAPRGRACPPAVHPPRYLRRTLPAGKSPDTQRENAKARAHGGPPRPLAALVPGVVRVRVRGGSHTVADVAHGEREQEVRLHRARLERGVLGRGTRRVTSSRVGHRGARHCTR